MTWAKPGNETGPWAPLTSFVGRDREADNVAKLLREHRLVTVTGPGGVGKTRLAVEVARTLTDQFPDGVCFVGLGTVSDSARVPAEVAAALGVRQSGTRPIREVLAEVLAAQRLLLVLDNCEHVLDEVAPLCGDLLGTADDLRILATSREQLWVGGEARYRLSPLTLPASDETAAIGDSEAVALFTERARQARRDFTLTPELAPLAARVASRLDGMPLAIELAAARVEALGMAVLADRIDDALRLLSTRDPLAAARHKSLSAVADWSYRLLPEDERRVFRRLAAFPAPFTLEAAEAVAGPGAGAVVLRLVDCSLVTPPQPGPDQRMRYPMLHTLRSFGQGELIGAGEADETAAARAAFALSVAERATAGLETTDRELAALLWLDAEEAILAQALSWALENELDTALRLAIALAPWWWLRGRYAEGYAQLSAATAHVSPGMPHWARAQLWLGNLCVYFSEYTTAVGHYTEVCEADAGNPTAPEAVEALSSRAVTQVNLGRSAEGARDAHDALALARQTGSVAAELQALTALSISAYYDGNVKEAVGWAEQTQEYPTAEVPGWVTRMCGMVLALVLTDADELDRARNASTDALSRSREVGDLVDLASLLLVRARLERRAGKRPEARTYLNETVHIAVRTGDWANLHNSLEECGYLCAETGRWPDAITLWAAQQADAERTGIPGNPSYDSRPEFTSDAQKALQPAQLRAARDRGARMSLLAAAELVAMLTAPSGNDTPRAATDLTERERELVTLVAQGRTDTQIAEQLSITIRTVASHLDRIRDKTGFRRRADLTRLALQRGLV